MFSNTFFPFSFQQILVYTFGLDSVKRDNFTSALTFNIDNISVIHIDKEHKVEFFPKINTQVS